MPPKGYKECRGGGHYLSPTEYQTLEGICDDCLAWQDEIDDAMGGGGVAYYDSDGMGRDSDGGKMWSDD